MNFLEERQKQKEIFPLAMIIIYAVCLDTEVHPIFSTT